MENDSIPLEQEKLNPANLSTENFTCFSCGGTMSFDIKSQQFRCSSCGNEGNIETLFNQVNEYDFSTYQQREDSSISFTGITNIICQNCGAEVVFDSHDTATICPMCKSSHVAIAKQKAGIPPDGIIPFKIDQYEAQEMFHKWIKSRWFAPNNLKKSYQEGALTGMYLPYWTYDANTIANYIGRGGTEHITKDNQGNTSTQIRWTIVGGIVQKYFDDIPVCASQKSNNNYLNDILPFNTSNKSLPFSASYLSGYQAERYSIRADEAFKTAQEIMEDELRTLARQQILRDYDLAEVHSLSAKYFNVKYKHILLPIWKAIFFYNNKEYQYLVNGETGKVSGKRPYSIPKILTAVIVAIIILMGLLWAGDAYGCDNEFSNENISSSIVETYTIED